MPGADKLGTMSIEDRTRIRIPRSVCGCVHTIRNGPLRWQSGVHTTYQLLSLSALHFIYTRLTAVLPHRAPRPVFGQPTVQQPGRRTKAHPANTATSAVKRRRTSKRVKAVARRAEAWQWGVAPLAILLVCLHPRGVRRVCAAFSLLNYSLRSPSSPTAFQDTNISIPSPPALRISVSGHPSRPTSAASGGTARCSVRTPQVDARRLVEGGPAYRDRRAEYARARGGAASPRPATTAAV
ncbi:hypothetical protein C8R44DRAFT_751572 [Mycena epipterygia]|nr:hypothetical protein C8R44DRAFT_751572 [Mycena epipterygia]